MRVSEPMAPSGRVEPPRVPATLKGDTVADPDRALREWLRAWAKDHPRYGYRRAYHDARAEGWVVNHKKIQRLWRDEGFRVLQRRRRASGSATVDAPIRTRRTWCGRWGLPVRRRRARTTDQDLLDRRRTHPGVHRRPRGALDYRRPTHRPPRGPRRRSGAPAVLRSDNGPEFIAGEAMADWAGDLHRPVLHPSGLAVAQRVSVAAFNSRIRDECLNINSFTRCTHRSSSATGRTSTTTTANTSLGYLTPAEYARQCTHQMETDDSQNVRTGMEGGGLEGSARRSGRGATPERLPGTLSI